MASLYDYGLPQLNQNMMSMYSTMQQEKRNKVLENAQNIENTAAMFKLNNEMKREQMLDKDIMFSGFMEAKGASPSVIDRTNKYLQSLGYMDQVGRIKARNLPIALQTMNQDTNFQLGILQDNWNDAGQKMSVLDEEINKMREKGDPEKQQDLAAKIMQRENLKVKQYNIKGLMEKLTGRKPDTSLTEAEILSLPETDQRRKNYIQGKQGVTASKPVNMPPWFDALGTSLMGSKYNTPEGQAAVSDWVADPKNKAQLTTFQREYAANNATPFFSVQQTSQGLQPVDVRTGKPSGTPIGNKPLTGEMITAEQQIGTLKDTLGRMEKLYKDDYVGPLAGRVGPLEEKTIGIDPERSQFQSQVAQLQNSLIYLMSGKQINEAEYQRLRKQIPEITLPPKNFKARMDEFKNTVDSIISERHKNMGGYGINQGNEATTSRTPQQEADEFFKKYGGK